MILILIVNIINAIIEIARRVMVIKEGEEGKSVKCTKGGGCISRRGIRGIELISALFWRRR